MRSATLWTSRGPDAMPDALLQVEALTKSFPVHTGFGKTSYLSAVDGVSFDVESGTTMGIVGESGCGKSTLARLILGLVEADSGGIKIQQQAIDWRKGTGRKELRRNMQMVFQNPYSSLNPRSSIGEIIAFPMRAHGVPRAEVTERTATLLEQVGLHANHASYYPYLLISHDLNVVEYMSDRVAVMYLGQIVETADADALYRRPLHPYTRALLAASPRLDPDQQLDDNLVEGELPSPLNPPSGCRFRTRCPYAMPACAEVRPALLEIDAGHQVACHLYSSDASTPEPLMEVSA